MPPDPKLVESVFHHALGQTDPAAYVAAACRGNAVLAGRVARLLAAHAELEASDDPVAAPAPPAGFEPPGVGPGTPVAGRYKVVERIGGGGMGTVWMAEQTRPVRRRVALKVVKPGMDSRPVLARFEAERQALALMDHPNIATVLDGGTTDDGRPYFVMELVKGVPITAFCDERRLTPRQRLELFVPVCQAIQHAHQKGVIHRDLKPSNVLVALYDDRPVPKVIDFGVAKATGQPLTEQTLHTGFGAVLGTVEYMSPEQAGFNQRDVDTRSDVYSLGVLLYELLAGTTPLEQRRAVETGLLEALRIIREEEAPTLSNRLGKTEELPAIAANRGLEPAKLTRLVRGELDWIVRKALEKDRDRRYATAGDLALDVQCFLDGKPVLAGPPGAGYRLCKFIRRHRGPVVAAAAVLAALVAGLAGTTWGLVRAEAARSAEADARRGQTERAEAEARQRERAEANERRANDERDRAEDEKRVAEAVRRFLQTDLLRQADAFAQANTLHLAGGGFEARENPTVRELLDRAAAEVTADKIEAKFPKQPRVQAEILQTIGSTYLGVGEYEKAIAHLTRARDQLTRSLGPDDPRTLVTSRNLAAANLYAGRTAEATALLRKVCDACVDKFGPDDPRTLTALNLLAIAHMEAGRKARAVALFERVSDAWVARFGPDDPRTLLAQNNLAGAYRSVDRITESIALLERVRDAHLTRFSPGHPNTLVTLNSLALSYQRAGRTAEAIALLEKVRDAKVAALGPDHPRTLNATGHLASAYQSAGRFDASVPLFEQTLRLRKAKLGPGHPGTVWTMARLGVNYHEVGRQDESVALLEEALALARKRPGPLPALLDWVPRALAATYDRGGQFARAESLHREVVAQARKKGRPDHPRVAGALSRQGLNLLPQGKAAEAEPILRECLAIREKNDPAGWRAFEAKVLLGGALLGQKKYAEAEPLVRAGYEGLKDRAAGAPAGSRARLRRALDWLIELAEARKDEEAAEKWRRERAALPP
jgi:tetratricopeptide (TPR) repeat protein